MSPRELSVKSLPSGVGERVCLSPQRSPPLSALEMIALGRSSQVVPRASRPDMGGEAFLLQKIYV